MLAERRTTDKEREAVTRLTDLCQQGHTLRLGTKATSRVYPAWDWQLFTPAGTYVESVSGLLLSAIRAAGLGDAIHGSQSELKGLNR
jgi:hypothetical protein